MSQFENVTVIKNANIYFDGKVTSRTLQFFNGESKTLGIMLPGDYTFNTDKQEIMEILSGEVAILLSGQTDWRQINAGEHFEVPANSSFQIRVNSVMDYCCSFID